MIVCDETIFILYFINEFQIVFLFKRVNLLILVKIQNFILFFIINQRVRVMQCPRCHARTLVLQKSKRVCKVPQCFYEDLHPISFDNDVRHYEGQKGGQNRFSSLYNAALDNGGITVDKQGNYDKQLKKGQRHIKDICLLFKLSQKIQSTSEARFITILQLQIRGKLQKQQRLQKQKKGEKQQNQNEKDKQKRRKNFSIKEMACYAVYSACFENENFFQDNNICNWLKVPKRQWQNLVKQLNNQLKNKIDFIPTEKPWHHVLRVCRRRKIDPQQQKAMIKMCETIYERGIQDGSKRITVAACVFWKICQNSIKYRDKIKLTDICKKHEQIKQLTSMQKQKYFQTTPDTIKKFFIDKMQKDFYQVYLPNWDGRIKKLLNYQL